MTTKKLLSLAVALAMAASTSATVFAADYPSDDDDDGNTTVVDTPTYGNGTSASAPTTVVTASTVSNVIRDAASKGTTATVYIDQTATISRSVLNNLSAPITLKASNYRITVDPSKMSEVTNIDCGIKANAPAAQATFEKFFKEPVATIACAQQGSFGGTITLEIKPDNLGKIDTSKTIYVFSWNPKTNSYSKMGTAVLLKNGQIRCEVSRGYNLILSNAASFTAK